MNRIEALENYEHKLKLAIRALSACQQDDYERGRMAAYEDALKEFHHLMKKYSEG